MLNFSDIKGCLAYPVTNHMKRDHLFSLSTATGNTYYMEVHFTAL